MKEIIVKEAIKYVADTRLGIKSRTDMLKGKYNLLKYKYDL